MPQRSNTASASRASSRRVSTRRAETSSSRRDCRCVRPTSRRARTGRRAARRCLSSVPDAARRPASASPWPRSKSNTPEWWPCAASQSRLRTVKARSYCGRSLTTRPSTSTHACDSNGSGRHPITSLRREAVTPQQPVATNDRCRHAARFTYQTHASSTAQTMSSAVATGRRTARRPAPRSQAHRRANPAGRREVERDQADPRLRRQHGEQAARQSGVLVMAGCQR